MHQTSSKENQESMLALKKNSKYNDAKNNILEEVGVPRRFRNATKLDIDAKVWSSVESFFTGESLFLSGGIGVGKTHLVCALCNEIVHGYVSEQIEKDPYFDSYFNSGFYGLKIISVPRFLLDLRATFKYKSTSEAEVISEYCDVKTLILDDLGAEKSSDWGIEVLYTLIDSRYIEENQTVITSNLTLDGITKTHGDRIASRIAEMCSIIELKGDDRRLEKTKKKGTSVAAD